MEIDYAPILLLLAMMTFLAVLAGAVWDMRRTDRALREHRHSSLMDAANRTPMGVAPPSRHGAGPTSPENRAPVPPREP